MLQKFYQRQLPEAGCDEAGRGCLAGPVFAAAVILDPHRNIPGLDDSKKLSEARREALRPQIEARARAWAVAYVEHDEIDRINILQATFRAMHLAVDALQVRPQLLVIDGNRFKPYPGVPHVCVVDGDATYQAIAAASILAKTYRDAWMNRIHAEYPEYGWDTNKGYGTRAHVLAVRAHGLSPYHRKSFRMGSEQQVLF